MKHLFIFLILLIAGCNARGPIYTATEQPTMNDAIVYFYRPDQFYQGGTYPYVYIDDIKRFSLKNNGYNFVRLTPGKHSYMIGNGMTWDFPDQKGWLKIEANKVYYLRLLPKLKSVNPNYVGASIAMNPITVHGSALLEVINNAQAEEEIKDTKLCR